MTFGTGPQALVTHLQDNWQTSRTGRNDVPDVVRDGNGDPSSDPADGRGVLILHDREEVELNHAVHDEIHVYHPQAEGLDFEDRGFDEKNVLESVQIDIEITDRTDESTGERLFARERMVGDRDAAGFPTDQSAPYPGLLGEVVYLLETIRRDFEEWDVTRMQPVNVILENSNATVSLDVELEHISANTVV